MRLLASWAALSLASFWQRSILAHKNEADEERRCRLFRTSAGSLRIWHRKGGRHVWMQRVVRFKEVCPSVFQKSFWKVSYEDHAEIRSVARGEIVRTKDHYCAATEGALFNLSSAVNALVKVPCQLSGLAEDLRACRWGQDGKPSGTGQ
ncbi:hypothetical protein PMIN06_006896 [Paraphaeosphaeria minitans]